jgi:hypothetical protein
VIEDNVEDHLNAGAVQRFDHVPELVEHCEGIRLRAVGVMRCEERDWLVPPVVHTPGGGVVGIELEDR